MFKKNNTEKLAQINASPQSRRIETINERRKIMELNEKDGLLRGFLNTALRELMAVMGAECGSLFIFDSGREELVLNSFYNSGNIDIHGLRQKIGEGVSGKVAATKMPILVKDINKDGRFRRNGFGHYRTGSFISIPLYTSAGLLGLINLADKSNGEAFSEKDLEFAVVISRYACLTIDSFASCAGLKQEKEALDKQKLLLEKYASVGKLAAGVVHEINNPLDGVIRYANILLEQIEHSSVAREYLLEVKNGLSRIANITKSLLDFSHQINSHQNKRYVDLRLVIDEAIDVTLEDIRNQNIHICKKHREGLPKILDLGISHVVTNLIKNAMDAMAGAGTLEVATDMLNSHVEIKIKDSGMGIPEEIKEQIFEPFFTTKTVGKGTGLGLSICQEIIHKYAGNIDVESIPGQGTVFTVLIPQKYLENA
jgi:signal transduction histidine kinase